MSDTELDRLKQAKRVARDALRKVRSDRADAAAEAHREVRQQFKARVEAAESAHRKAEIAIDRHVSGAASHKWEGQKVTRMEYSGSGRRGGGKRIFGVLRVRRFDTEFSQALPAWGNL